MKRYAAASGIIIGWAIGAVIGIPLHAVVELGVTFSLVGLIVGYVLSQQPGNKSHLSEPLSKPAASERLAQLDLLRSKSQISEAEYQAKRKQILDEV